MYFEKPTVSTLYSTATVGWLHIVATVSVQGHPKEGIEFSWVRFASQIFGRGGEGTWLKDD